MSGVSGALIGLIALLCIVIHQIFFFCFYSLSSFVFVIHIDDSDSENMFVNFPSILESGIYVEGSQVGGDDGNSCHEECEGGHEGPGGAAPRVHRVAVVRVAPAER